MLRNTSIFLLFTASLLGNPSVAPTVQSGSATVTGIGTSSVTVNTGSTTTVLDWDNFSIGTSEQVMFSRSGSSSTYYIFNNVTGGIASTIAGALQTEQDNGNIFLCNPSGLVISSTGSVLTGAFVGTTLDLVGSFNPTSNMTFTGSSTETITNSGSVQALNGDAIFMGYRIVNSGSVTASGVSALGAGVSIRLEPSNVQRLVINTAGASGTGTGIDVQSAGTVTGESVMLIADGNPYTLAINMAGTVTATACSSEAGRVRLIADPKTNSKGAVEVLGTIGRNATTGCGPDVEVHGYTIALQPGSTINVSGTTGGGAVTIGDQTTYPTSNIYTAPTAQILTNGTSAGSGGNVTFYAANSILHRGTIESKGAGTGNGGAISMTSPGYLGYDGAVDASVSGTGTAGRLSVSTSAIDLAGTANYGSNFAPTSWTTANVTSVMTKTTLQNTLATTNVTATASGTNTTGNLRVVDDFTWSSGRNLTMVGDAMIQIDYDVTMTGSSSASSTIVNMTAPIILIGTAAQTQTRSAGIDLTSGGITSSASNHLSIYGGGSTNAYSRLNTASGTNTVSFGNNFRIIGGDAMGANAEMKGTTATINALTEGTGNILVQAADCSSAFIDADTVNIGVTTKPQNLTVTGGCCSSDNEAYIGKTASGSDITIHTTGDIQLTGGTSGSSNKASIISNGGTSRAIVITADDVILDAGAGGSNNTARISSVGSGGTVTITASQDVRLTGGSSSATATSAEIRGDTVTYTATRDVHLTAGDGTLNRAYIEGFSGVTGTVGRHHALQGGTALNACAEVKTNNGNILIDSSTTASNFTFRAGTTGSNNCLARLLVNGTGNIHVGNVKAPATVELVGGSTGISPFTEFLIGTSGNIVIKALNDVKFQGGGTGTATHAGALTNSGNIVVEAGRDVSLTTGTHTSSNTYIHTKNGVITVTGGRDVTLTGNCSIPNRAYIRSKTGTTVTATRDIVQRGLTEISATNGLGATVQAGGRHLIFGCGGSNALGQHQSEYYKYPFLYELFYSLRYLTYLDWFLNLSDDFWKRVYYVDP